MKSNAFRNAVSSKSSIVARLYNAGLSLVILVIHLPLLSTVEQDMSYYFKGYVGFLKSTTYLQLAS